MPHTLRKKTTRPTGRPKSRMYRGIDLAVVRRNLEARWRKQDQENIKRFSEARRDARSIIGMIRKKYHPSRIYQWGSLLDKRTFNARSDIDIAVEGITGAETFFRLFGDAQDMTALPLDIVQIEKIEPEFADIIRLKGKVVYEKK
jgi:predicted nucleotidyltransferase